MIHLGTPKILRDKIITLYNGTFNALPLEKSKIKGFGFPALLLYSTPSNAIAEAIQLAKSENSKTAYLYSCVISSNLFQEYNFKGYGTEDSEFADRLRECHTSKKAGVIFKNILHGSTPNKPQEATEIYVVLDFKTILSSNIIQDLSSYLTIEINQ